MFKPGQSGNPSGGQYAQKLAAYVRSLAGNDGKVYIEKLHAIAVDPHRDTKSRIAALQMLLDRGWGKPKETIALEGSLACTVTPEALARLSDDDLRAIVDIGTRLQEALAAGSLPPASEDA